MCLRVTLDAQQNKRLITVVVCRAPSGRSGTKRERRKCPNRDLSRKRTATRRTVSYIHPIAFSFIIHEVPGPDHPWGWWGWNLRARAPIWARTARYNENLQSRTNWALKFAVNNVNVVCSKPRSTKRSNLGCFGASYAKIVVVYINNISKQRG